MTALSSTIIKISNIKWIWFWKKIFQHSSRASETWTINAKVHWNCLWWILFNPEINPEVWRSWQAREQCTTSTSFATHIIFICDFLNRKKTKKKRNNARETTTNVFLTKGKRQKHLFDLNTTTQPEPPQFTSPTFIPANYPADVFGKIKKAINLIETRARFQAGAKTRRSLQQRLLFSLSCRNNTKKAVNSDAE